MILEENKYYTDGDAFVLLQSLDESSSSRIYGKGVRLSTNVYAIHNHFGLDGGVRYLTEKEELWLKECINKQRVIPYPKEINYEIY